jgi:hypothetical protein
MRGVEQAIDDAPSARFERDALENEPQLLWGMEHLDLASPLQSAQAQDQPGSGVEGPDHRKHHQGEDAQRRGRPQSHGFRALDGQ